jgi:CRP/FNR family cyclic AMP-dependent transcriptional regulator
MKTIEDLIAEHAFFRGCDAAAIAFVAGCGRNVHFQAGTRLMSEGESADAFYLLRSGRVALGYFDPDRGDLVVETLQGGDVLGWSWLFAPYRWHFDVDALEAVSAVAFDAPCLRGKCEADPRLGYELTRRFSRVMLDRLQATRLRLLDVYGPVGSR